MVSGQAYTYLPPGIAPDSLHAPFFHGIASGDPLADRVILWTRITPDGEHSDSALSVNYIVAQDENFTSTIATGQVTTNASRDFTVKVDVTGLQPDTYYYYRFKDASGAMSAMGRTRTLPVGHVERVWLAVASCSNVYYGYFNAYRDISRNDEISAVVHLGDFIYNNNGRNSPTRIPQPEPYTLNENNSKAEWDARHAYYHFDVDLRAMLAAHPIIAIWDNHDMSNQNHVPAIRAWLDWMPVREDPDDFMRLYRKFSFGDLIDLMMMEVRIYRDIDLLPGGEYHYLGWDQYDWLTGQLLDDGARWKLIGSQKNYATWNLGWVADLFDLNSPFFTTSNWDGQLETRNLMNEFFMDNGIENLVFLTGDAHMGLLAEIDPDPFDNDEDYDARTGEGSLGVEFLPSGVTGRNLDDRGVPSALAPVVEAISQSINPHQFYLNMAHNGYGLLDIRPDSLTGYIRYNNILQSTDGHWQHGPFIVFNGENHWKRPGQSYTVPTFVNGIDQAKLGISEVYPNPASDQVSLRITAAASADVVIKIIGIDGAARSHGAETRQVIQTGPQVITLPTADLPPGNYLLTIRAQGSVSSRQFGIVR